MAGERAFQLISVDTDTTDSDQNVDALISGLQWDVTSSNVITYSFIDAASDIGYDPGVTFANQHSSAQQTAARAALAEYAAIANLVFEEIGDDPGEDNAEGTIRFADATGLDTAFAYLPTSLEAGGDIYFADTEYETAPIGSFEFHTFMHELGHALGLKHGHEDSAGGSLPNAGPMTDDRDGMEYSLMTYNSFIGQHEAPGFYTNSSGHFAQTPMMFDIAAIQRMYGANFGENAGDTTYTFDATTGEAFINGVGQGTPQAAVTFRTLWDGEGEDTYDLSNFTTDLNIDLRAGEYSDFDVGGTALRARLNAGFDSSGNFVGASEYEYASGHLYNALQYEGSTQSLIENAIGGDGDDTLQGNQARNTLVGGNGSDRLFGASGRDTLDGGIRNDLLVGGGGHDTLDGGSGNDRLRGNGGDDIIKGGGGNDRLNGNGGADVFVYESNRNSGNDRITGWADGQDSLEFDGDVTFADLTIVDDGTDTVVSWDLSSITFLDTTGVIDESDFNFV